MVKIYPPILWMRAEIPITLMENYCLDNCSETLWTYSGSLTQMGDLP